MAVMTFRGAVINLYPANKYNTAIEVSYSYSLPTGEIGDLSLPLPDLAREAIVSLAVAEILAFPGEYQNLNLSAMKKQEGEIKLNELRALGAVGRGPAFYQAPQLSGTRPWGPWGSISYSGWGWM